MGHEIAKNLTGKNVMAAFWRRRAYNVAIEAGSDVLAWKVINGQLTQVFCEYENSTKNAVKNFQRNRKCAIGAAKFLILVENQKMRVAMRRHLNKRLPPESARKIGIAILDTLRAKT